MNRLLRTLLVSLLLPAAGAIAGESPLTTHNRFVYSGLEKILLRAADVMPEENYSFRPTESVRTFGQIVGHVADSQYAFCSAALGEKNPAPQVEKTKATKADLIAALKGAFSYCDRAYDGMTDTSGAETVKFHGGDTPKLGVLTVNLVHSTEHYGNLVTYLRMKSLVPPTSDPAFMKELMK